MAIATAMQRMGCSTIHQFTNLSSVGVQRLAQHPARPCIARYTKTDTTQISSPSSSNEPLESSSSFPRYLPSNTATWTAAAAAASLTLLAADPALALTIHTEPSNALSLPTWAVHTSSVMEWVGAMALVWRWAEVSGRPVIKGLAWGMLPSLGSAMCACTWHFFYNSEDLEFIVSLQAFLTVVGNATCWYAAWRMYKSSIGELNNSA